ncbi:MAG: shikimate kinase [Sphingopyxis sp.]|jgi:shikimate kinase|nr:shikimate kinase [Sphingopyxis sp.]
MSLHDDQDAHQNAEKPGQRLPIDRPIVLVGMMGSGKSTIGRRLAARLALPFFDADEEIERAADMPIAEIFARFGEAHFRDGEHRVIRRLLESGPSVIATGGGAFIDPRTRAAVNQNGIGIWLDVPVDVLVERTARRNHRPLLRQGDPRTILTNLLDARRDGYASARLHVRSSASPHARTVDAVLDALMRDYRERSPT